MDLKVGFASGDWSESVNEPDGSPCMGGSGWIRFGQYTKYLTVPHVIGVLVFNNDLGIFGVTDWNDNHHFDRDIPWQNLIRHNYDCLLNDFECQVRATLGAR